MDKRIKKLKKKMIRTKMLQEELEHRMEIEKKVFKLFSIGKFEEGQKLLNTLDNEKLKKLAGDEIDNEELPQENIENCGIRQEHKKQMLNKKGKHLFTGIKKLDHHFYDDIFSISYPRR